VYELESGRSRLFDRDHDPAEARNLAARHPADVRRYAEDLRSWSAAQKSRLQRKR